MKDEAKKAMIIKEFFDTGIWKLIWKSAKARVCAGARPTLLPFKTVSGIRDSFSTLKCLEFPGRN